MTTSGPASAGLERVLRLHDGRHLTVTESGDPDGVPVFFFHGTPGSRRTGPTEPDLARSVGIRLLTFDRPGYGGSTRQPGRVVHDCSLDVEDLADQLDCPTFGLAAWSGGAAFALAAAEVHGSRVRAVSIVAPLGPFDDVEATEYLPAERARHMRVLRSRQMGTRTTALVARWGLRRSAAARVDDPAAHIDQATLRASPADRAVLARPDVRHQLIADSAEAFRQGADGWADDLAAIAKPWAIEYRAISPHVTIWHGCDDADVAPGAARDLAGAIPNCELREVQGAGHFVLYDLWSEVLTAAADGAG